MINPHLFLRLAQEINNNRDDLNKHCQNSTISKSKPEFTTTNEPRRAIRYSHAHKDLPVEKLRIRSTSRYILEADISRCYPSIYTHAIPWALHTKSVSKAKKSDNTLLGNRLDGIVRDCQDGQTIGIPIGPDTSIVLSEIILSECDLKLPTNGLRYVDDYEFGFRTYSEAEQCLAELRGILKEFELEINQHKTNIFELPLPLDALWTYKLRTFKFRDDEKNQLIDLMSFFDLAIDLAKTYSEDAVLKYCIKMLQKLMEDKDLFRDSNWKYIEDFLFYSLASDSTLIYSVLTVFQKAQKAQETEKTVVDKDRLGEFLNQEIVEKCLTRQSHEIVWALWALIFWNIDVNTEAAKSLSRVMDSTVVLSALHAKERGLVKTEFDVSEWEKLMIEGELYGSHWLLAYEAKVKGWLGKGKRDYFDDFFKSLRQNNVEFYSEVLVSSQTVSLTGVGVESDYNFWDITDEDAWFLHALNKDE